MSYLLDVQKYNREMLEENYLKPLNLPTKTDIDEINKELYSLKKTVKGINLQDQRTVRGINNQWIFKGETI